MKHKVLLVDDEHTSLMRSLVLSLSSEMWEVALAENVQRASERADAGETDLLVIVLESRTAAGWAAIDEITEADPLLPVIVVTSQPDLQGLAEAVGARALVEAPVNVPALLQTMRELLGEPVAKRTHGSRAEDKLFRLVPASSEGFREMLYRRYTAPYELAPSVRHWGINE